MLSLRICLTALIVVVSLLSSLNRSNAIKIALFNGKPYHLEILCGFMHVLRDHAVDTTVYIHYLNMPNRKLDFGFLEWVKNYPGKLQALPNNISSLPKFDVAIFISPEYHIGNVREILNRTEAKLAVLMVHNADAMSLMSMRGLHSNMKIVALSPHVVNHLRLNSQTEAEWLLPVYPLQPQKPCYIWNMTVCVSGFAVQGNMDSKRRNYSSVWQGMQSKLSQSSRTDKRFKVNVIGNGSPATLGVPFLLRDMVETRIRLRFVEFYNVIYHNLALLPILASDSYLKTKFSSTIVSSLITGTPIISNSGILHAYTFLNKSTTIFQNDGEDISDVMVKVLQMSPLQMKVQRETIQRLRNYLNARAKNILEDWFTNLL